MVNKPRIRNQWIGKNTTYRVFNEVDDYINAYCSENQPALETEWFTKWYEWYHKEGGYNIGNKDSSIQVQSLALTGNIHSSVHQIITALIDLIPPLKNDFTINEINKQGNIKYTLQPYQSITSPNPYTPTTAIAPSLNTTKTTIPTINRFSLLQNDDDNDDDDENEEIDNDGNDTTNANQNVGNDSNNDGNDRKNDSNNDGNDRMNKNINDKKDYNIEDNVTNTVTMEEDNEDMNNKRTTNIGDNTKNKKTIKDSIDKATAESDKLFQHLKSPYTTTSANNTRKTKDTSNSAIDSIHDSDIFDDNDYPQTPLRTSITTRKQHTPQNIPSVLKSRVDYLVHRVDGLSDYHDVTIAALEENIQTLSKRMDKKKDQQ